MHHGWKANCVVFAISLLFTIVLQRCNVSAKDDQADLQNRRPAFQQQVDGKRTDLFIIRNDKGMQAAITNYGARLVSLLVPDKKGIPTDVVMGFDSLQQYQHSTEPYFGATIGRYGNRIGKGRFSIDGKEFQLSINNGPNTLHGGTNGFQYRVWDARPIGDSSLELVYVSKDGEEGFPGNLAVKVIYTITAANSLSCIYTAMTDQPTVVNLTNHAFFNLNGKGSIYGHLLQVNADSFTPVDTTLIPTGIIAPVDGTPFDFRTATAIGKRIDLENLQLQFGKGYDHNYVLNGKGMKKAAMAQGDASGIVMEVWTEEPGLQFYSGNFMQSKNKLRTGPDDFRTAFCLETQHFPDGPNQPEFPNTVLRPGENYHTVSEYKFYIKR